MVTDDFNRADSGTLGANWTDLIAGIGITGNEAACMASPASWIEERTAYYTGVSWNDDQSSQITIVAIGNPNNRAAGPGVRASGNGATGQGYFVYCDATSIYLFKMVGGVFTTLLLNTLASASITDLIKLVATGTTLEIFRNGGSIGSTTDASFSAGSPGFMASNNTGAGQAIIDDWVGTGEIVGGAFIPQPNKLGMTAAVRRSNFW